jgi:hypothetical protein
MYWFPVIEIENRWLGFLKFLLNGPVSLNHFKIKSRSITVNSSNIWAIVLKSTFLARYSAIIFISALYGSPLHIILPLLP